MKRIAVIGCGFSGLMTAYHLLAHGGESVRVTIFDPDGENFGAAYKTTCRAHVLNVRAKNMGAFPSAPGDFVEWCEKQGWGVVPDSFVRRSIYQSYLKSIKDKLIKRASHSLQIRTERVENVIPTDTSVIVRSSDEALFDAVVLALGNLPPKPLPCSSPNIIQDPWAKDGLRRIPNEASVAIIGIGLTGIDIVLALDELGHTGRITAFSPKGLFPLVHSSVPKYVTDSTSLPWEETRLRKMFASLRSHAERAPNWQSALEWARPHYQEMWRALSRSDQSRFLRHGNRYWNILRHRIPSQVDSRIHELLASGTLSLHSAFVNKMSVGANGEILVSTKKETTFSVQWLINCTGPTYGETLGVSPLVDAMHRAGVVRAGPHNMGLDSTPSGEVLDASGSISRNLFVIGGLRKGVLWETTSVPDLRSQALEVALKVLQEGS